jgi:hypothetical protein
LNTAAQAAPTLKGLADVSSLTATASELERVPFSDMRDKELQFVQITLRNDSQQVAIVNGDAAEAAVKSETAPAVGGRYLVMSAKPGVSTKKRIVIAGASLGTAALAGPIVYEFVTPDQHRDRSLGEAIGSDGTRHRVEADRFGVRVLMPGDETTGWMAFSCQLAQSLKSVTIPLSFSRSLTPDGVLEIPIKAQAGKEGAMSAPNTVQRQKAAANAIKNAEQSAQQSGAPKPSPGMGGLMQEPTFPAQDGTPPATATPTQQPSPATPIQ